MSGAGGKTSERKSDDRKSDADKSAKRFWPCAPVVADVLVITKSELTVLKTKTKQSSNEIAFLIIILLKTC